jgi:hypothetical protein
MYKGFNKVEQEQLNKVFFEHNNYLSDLYKIVVDDMVYEYSENNTFVKIGLHTTVYYEQITQRFDCTFPKDFRMDTAQNNSLHIQFNLLLKSMV